MRYGITSLPHAVADAKRIMQLARKEWAIENSLHHRRDESLRKDWSRLRRGESQKVNAILNNTVVGIGALLQETNLQAWRRELSYNPNRAISVKQDRFCQGFDYVLALDSTASYIDI